MCQPSGTVLYSCQQMPNLLGKNVLVMGQGSIGLSFTMITSRIGARNVIAVDLLDYRLEASKGFGSTHQVNPDKEDLEAAVAEITGGVGADVVVEAAGYADTFNMDVPPGAPERHHHRLRHPGRGFIPLEHNWLMDKQPRIIPTTGARSGNPISHIQEIVPFARGAGAIRQSWLLIRWDSLMCRRPTICTTSATTTSSRW